MIIVDDRLELTQEDRAKYTYCVAATDKFMSGWGNASGGNSYVVFCCEPKNGWKLDTWMQNRGDFIRVRKVLPSYKPSANYCAHVHYYVVTDAHCAVN